MDSFRYVGNTATEIELDDRDGDETVTVMRPIEPGEFTGPIDVDEDHPHNKMLSDEGKLLLLPPEETDAEREAREKQEAEDKKAADKAAADAAATTGGKPGESS